MRQRFGTTLQRLDKEAGDFGTNADIEAENAMLALPEDAILGEESELDHYLGRLEHVRAKTLAELARRDDQWLEEQTSSRHWS